MKFNRLTFILIIGMVLLTSVVIATPLESLNQFYQTSIDKDVDAYIAIQDPFFLAEQWDNPEKFVESMFDEVNILTYEIINADINEEGNTALIFYELKGEFDIQGEKSSIDNDMVAFLWKYDDWKVRWTITRKLYEEKLAINMITDTAFESIFEEANEQTLQQEMIDEGFDIVIEEGELNRTGFLTYVMKFLVNVFKLLFVLFIIIAIYFVISKNKTKFKKINPKIKKVTTWCMVTLIPKMIIFSKQIWKKTKIISKQAYHHSKKAYHNQIKPTIKKMHKHLKNKTKKFSQKILSKMHEIQKNQEIKEKQVTQKTGLTRSERDINKYHRDVMMEEDVNSEVDTDSDED